MKVRAMNVLKRWYGWLKKVMGRLRSEPTFPKVMTYAEDDREGMAGIGSVASRHQPALKRASYPSDARPSDCRNGSYPLLDGSPMPYGEGKGSDAPARDIDSSALRGLEGFAEEWSVSEDTIARWINAGILSPQETALAEKILKLIRHKNRGRGC